jgi:hypothetical protein
MLEQILNGTKVTAEKRAHILAEMREIARGLIDLAAKDLTTKNGYGVVYGALAGHAKTVRWLLVCALIDAGYDRQTLTSVVNALD